MYIEMAQCSMLLMLINSIDRLGKTVQNKTMLGQLVKEGKDRPRNDITTLALYGHGIETILFFSMGHGKVIHFPIIIWYYKH